MRNFQSTVFTKTQTYREIFKSTLNCFKLFENFIFQLILVAGFLSLCEIYFLQVFFNTLSEVSFDCFNNDSA